MQKFILVIVLVLLIALVGCQQQADTSDNAENLQNDNTETKSNLDITVPPVDVSSKDPSEMILGVNDFPEGWNLLSRAERVKSDVSDEGLNKGWKGGYMASFGWQDSDNPFVVSRVDQYISIYPVEVLTEMLPKESNENKTYEALSNPKLGDASVAYKVTTTDEFGDSNSFYEIIFYKKDVLVTLILDGTAQDYELLKDLAKESASLVK